MKNLIIKSNEGKIVTTSLIVAKVFEKEHNKVVRDIQNLECSEEFNAANFGVIYFKDTMNRKQVAYEMTKDGFSFLVMGYTGSKAARFKEDYINAFNNATASLQKHNPELPQSFAQALRLAAEKAEENERLQEINQLQQNQLTHKQQVLEVQATQIKELVPKAEYTEKVLLSSETYVITRIAQELEISAYSLNNKLREHRVQRKVDGQWILYNKYVDKGYAKSHTVYYIKKDGTEGTNTQTVWTEKGRQFIHLMLKQEKIA